MTICYFTASGNCLYVARRIGGTLLSIPQLMRQEKIEIVDDAVGIVCPVYAVELPFMIVDFMKKADIKTDYFFFILTCGYGYEVFKAVSTGNHTNAIIKSQSFRAKDPESSGVGCNWSRCKAVFPDSILCEV